MPVSRVRSPSKLIVSTNVPIAPARTRLVRAPAQQMLALGSGAAAVPTWVRLACQVPHQEQDNWCWCATTLGVHKYYVKSDTTTQCQAANLILGRTDACVSPSDPGINKPYYLDKSLAAFSHMKGSTIGAPLPFSQLDQEISGDSPVGARIGWPDDEGGHFMAIVGYIDAPVPRIAISDPYYGESDIDYDLYCKAYQGNGTWTHSYLTQ